MPLYEYRCQDCREEFGIERSMNDVSQPVCAECTSANVNRIWNATIRAGGRTPEVGQRTASRSAKQSGGCGPTSGHSCGSCH